MKCRFLLPVLLATVLLSSAQTSRERYEAMALPVADIGNAEGLVSVTIGIERYTSEADIQELSAVAKRGSDALYRALDNQKRLGWISVPDRVSIDAKYIVGRQTDKGRIVTFITQNPIYYFEPRDRDRPRDYRFGVVQLVFDKNDKGTGKVTAAARIKVLNGEKVELDSYTEPAELRSVHPSP